MLLSKTVWMILALCVPCSAVRADVAEARAVDIDGAEQAGAVFVDGRLVLRILVADGDLSAPDRAKIIADRLNQLLKEGVIPEQITFREIRGETAIVFEDFVIATVDRQTAERETLSVARLAERWRSALVESLLALEKPLPADEAAAAGQTSPSVPAVTKYVAANGMTFLLSRRAGATTVAVRVTVGSGSIHDGERLGHGLAYAVSQTVPLGTRQRSREQVETELERLGGKFTVRAGHESVGYQLVTGKDRLVDALELLSDLVRNATFPPDLIQGTFARSGSMAAAHGRGRVEVIAERQLLAAMFRRHPIRYPVEGRDELRGVLTRQDLLAYFNRHYVPENAVCTVVGGFNEGAVLPALERVFGQWVYRAAPQQAVTLEPPQTGPRRRTITMPIAPEWGAVGWRTVPIWHSAAAPLRIIVALLGEGESARFPAAVRDQGEVAKQLRVRLIAPGFNAGCLAVFWTAPFDTHQTVENALVQETRRLQEELVDEKELQAAVGHVLQTHVDLLAAPASAAEMVTAHERATGDPEFARLFMARLSQVTPTSLRFVAQRYLTLDRATSVTLKMSAPSPSVDAPWAPISE